MSGSTTFMDLPVLTNCFSRIGSNTGSSSSSTFSISRGLPKLRHSSRYSLKPLCVSDVIFSWFLMFLLVSQDFPWPCGSMSRGYLVALVTMSAFWMLKSSTGRPWRFHSPISDSSVRKSVMDIDSVTGICDSTQSFSKTSLRSISRYSLLKGPR